MNAIKCPLCTHILTTPLQQCPACDRPLPRGFYEQCRNAPPIWLMTGGFPKHGKTTYLSALILKLENLGQVLPGAYHLCRDGYTNDAIRQMRRETQLGDQPPATPRGATQPLVISIHHLPEQTDRTIVMYDVPGEIFHSLEEIPDYVPGLSEIQTIWMLVSLSELNANADGYSLPGLFHAYFTALDQKKVDLTKLSVVVVYTKADMVENFPAAVSEYLLSDPYRRSVGGADADKGRGFAMSAYLQEMERISQVLEEFTDRNVKGGNAFVNMGRHLGMKLKFSAVSALGQAPDQEYNRLQSEAEPARVLDPFLWSLWLSRPADTVKRAQDDQLLLLLDSGGAAQPLYDEGLALALWNELKLRGFPARVHYLGQSKAVSHPGQTPPARPAQRPRHRLIGPILEQSQGTRAVVLTTGPISDLADFRSGVWRHSLFLVTTEEDDAADWPLTFHYRSGDSASAIVDLLTAARPE